MYILSFYCGHDSSVCLLKDGKVLTHLEVERVTRVKRHHGKYLNDPRKNRGKPWQKKGILYFIELVLKENRLKWKDIDYVAVTPDFDDKKFVPKNIPFIEVNHHDAHAASTFYLSPFKKSLILTLDGGGNDGGGLFGIGKDNKIKVIKKFPNGAIGITWTEAMKYWSDTVHGPIGTEGVLMGGAAYGKLNRKLSDYFYKRFKNYKPLNKGEIESIIEGHKRRRLVIKHIDKKKEDERTFFCFCRSLQEATNRIFLDYFLELLKLDSSKNISLAGGVVLNCVALEKVLEKYPHLKFYFSPALNDAGVTIGTTLWVYHQVLGKKRVVKNKIQSPYLGLERTRFSYPKMFRKYKQLEVKRRATTSELVDLLTKGKIISLYNGRSESGRRALGNRSIVGDPRKNEMKKIVNEKVKHRHWYRPFAPSVLKEEAGYVFETEVESPYMTLAVPVKKMWQDKIPAVVHKDGTSRLQTVTSEINPFFYKLIKAFYKKTGVPLVLNTSFNDNEPIVETPEDAIGCFLGTNIDYLYMEGYLLSKK